MSGRILLAIESSCDETAAAVIREDRTVLSSVVASQFELHQDFGGVVPEIASRAHVRRIIPVIQQAIREAGCSAADLCAVAVTTQPGLVGSLLVGLTAAKTVAMSLNIPLVTVDHVDAHIFACGMTAGRLHESIYPCVGLVISGGHTNLYDCRSATENRLVGGTTDDAAGEAFDKVARILGLPYPGGPSIQNAAVGGDPRRFRMPRPLMHSGRLDFSFSGLKTAVLYAARGVPGPDQLTETPPDRVNDLAAAFQEAVADVLVHKTRLALQQMGHRRLCIGGGVAANSAIRQAMQEMARHDGIELLIAPLQLCTDNAAMAAIAWDWLEQGKTSSLEVDVLPGLVRAV
ncbi:MAG: tRNA (adenosine(37)-N6)-threonylcarbamoyltransferase complex transferase subunit TsaD [Planctomycetaceae bacterium]|nr:tRNA (adenosine(37)-N6)-threonylcarbamoyltransferase complex transferase subunit TsaD [Planctomycetaceae bacterium]